LNTPITISNKKLERDVSIYVPGSKSESNRALIINALCPKPGQIDNLASARDTETMVNCLSQNGQVYDVKDAGTTMRFLTAYLAVSTSNAEITGTKRMLKRPIKVLVEALNDLGADIEYLGEPGYPPLKINEFGSQQTNLLTIPGNVSSQYISALLMIAPRLPNGLTLTLTDGVVSRPYIDMTLSLMHHFGVEVTTADHTFKILPQTYTYHSFAVESDWSGVSYWYSFFKLSDLEQLTLPGFKRNSFQGDRAIANIMSEFGVKTTYHEEGITLSRQQSDLPGHIDFVNCPDLAQTVAVVCAAIGHTCIFTGLQTLKIKETDRVKALKNELGRFGADFVEKDDQWTVVPGSEPIQSFSRIDFDTYEDHRMAMAFAPLGLFTEVSFDDKTVVNKSYPSFWQDMERIGMQIAP
jgi:3-phosphoshikimate 1-carboxyvinyltransferase